MEGCFARESSQRRLSRGRLYPNVAAAAQYVHSIVMLFGPAGVLRVTSPLYAIHLTFV